jgi:dipeptidyl aminopeptidase/acylaminoacyl peptidase
MVLRLTMLLVLVICTCVLVSLSASPLLPPAPQLSFTAVIEQNIAPGLYLYDPQRQLIVTLVHPANALLTPTWSPDGSRLAYVTSGAGRAAADTIVVYGVRSGERARVYYSMRAEAEVRHAPLWSPAQNNLIFHYGITSMARGVGVEILQVHLPGREVTQMRLPGVYGADQSRLRWRDEQRILNVSINVEHVLVQEIQVPGLRAHTLREWQLPLSNYRMPVISHDTQQILIAAVAPPSSSPDLLLFDLNTGEFRNLTNSEFTNESQPVWSQDDTRIAYQILGNPFTAIGFATPTSERRRIVYLRDVQALNIWDLQWTPDNSAVVFGASMPGGQHLCFLKIGEEIPDCPLRMRSLGGISWRPPLR